MNSIFWIYFVEYVNQLNFHPYNPCMANFWKLLYFLSFTFRSSTYSDVCELFKIVDGYNSQEICQSQMRYRTFRLIRKNNALIECVQPFRTNRWLWLNACIRNHKTMFDVYIFLLHMIRIQKSSSIGRRRHYCTKTWDNDVDTISKCFAIAAHAVKMDIYLELVIFFIQMKCAPFEDEEFLVSYYYCESNLCGSVNEA